MVFASPSSAVSEIHYELLRDAIFDDDKDRVEELIKLPGVEIDHFDAGGQTLLHFACFLGRLSIVKLLLHGGASVKTKNAAGCTALDLATHWGHSSVAEVIRLRGGTSVWQEKMGKLQIQVEDLNIQIEQAQQRYIAKQQQHEQLVKDFHELYVQFEEEKSAHLLSKHALEMAATEHHELKLDIQRFTDVIDKLREDYQNALVAKATADNQRDEAMNEADEILKHRNEILVIMQESVRKQELATQNWQRAEVAAAIADSQRNFAFAERDQYRTRHQAVLGELLIVTERLTTTEEELMVLKTDLAEYIYEKKRERTNQKRVARALEGTFGYTNEKNNSNPTIASTRRSSIEGNESIKDDKQTKKKKPYFTLAAREFGARMRAEEGVKQQQRAKRLQHAQNQYRSEGLHANVVDPEHFQKEFVSQLKVFTTARHAKWKELKKDRDRQAHFAATNLARSIATAPTPIRNHPQDNIDSNILTPVQNVKKTDTATSRNFSIYSKYAAGHGSTTRLATSSMGIRMEAAFLATGTQNQQSGSNSTIVQGAEGGLKQESSVDERANGSEVVSRPIVLLPLV